MKTTRFILALFAVFLSAASAAETAEKSSPVGYWETISDVTKKPRSIVWLYETDGVLYGKIVKNLDPAEGEGKLCTECPGEFHDKPVIGLQFLWGLKEKEGNWKGGRVLDPDNGKIYRCKLAVQEGGETLNVRGYLGISLLGRTQTWKRAEKP